MKLTAICIGHAARLPGKSFRTGIGKAPVRSPVILDAAGLLGDAVCNARHHGGPDQAVLLEGSLTMEWWAQQLRRPFEAGLFGENLVIEGLDNRDVAAGDRFRIGECLLEATGPRIACATLAARLEDPAFVRRYTQAARPGIYCRVLRGGMLEEGEVVVHEPAGAGRVGMVDILRALTSKDLTGAERQRILAAPVGERVRRALS